MRMLIPTTSVVGAFNFSLREEADHRCLTLCCRNTHNSSENVKKFILSTPAGWHICRKGTRGDPHPSGVQYPSFPIGQFLQGCSPLLTAQNIAPRWGEGCQQRAPLQICHPAGVERMNFFTRSSAVDIVWSGSQRQRKSKSIHLALFNLLVYDYRLVFRLIVLSMRRRPR